MLVTTCEHNPAQDQQGVKEIQCWNSLRAILATLMPCCGWRATSALIKSDLHLTYTSTTVTGTLFGRRKGKVNFCMQEAPATPPFLLLEFAIPTYVLVKEMKSDVLRITLECEKKRNGEEEYGAIFEEPIWNMYCNGRKVGFAFRKESLERDAVMSSFISLMNSVSIGAGVFPAPQEEEEIIYMRATYERIVGSSDSQAFHMINPDGTPGHELSIFLHRP